MKSLVALALLGSLLISLTIPTATAQLDDFEVEVLEYQADKVIPGGSFDLAVRVWKPPDVWITSGKIHAYIYDHVDNQRLIYNAGGEKSVASAEAYLYELKWGTFEGVEENYQWSLPVAENAPVGEDLRLAISMNVDLSKLRVKIGDEIYTGENLENLIVNQYPEDPVGSGWHVIQKPPPTSVAVKVKDIAPPLTSPYLNVKNIRYDVLVRPRPQQIPYVWIIIAQFIIIVALLVIIKTRKGPPKEIEIEITR